MYNSYKTRIIQFLGPEGEDERNMDVSNYSLGAANARKNDDIEESQTSTLPYELSIPA